MRNGYKIMRQFEDENCNPIARSLTKIKPNKMFHDFAISQEPIDEIDSNFFYFKGMN